MKPLNRFTYSAVALTLASLLLGALSHVQGRMNRLRVEYELTETAATENAPPLVAFTTVALGGFRGLLADLLWLRSTRLQDEGNYFEMFQLASWIVKLQPRYTGATAYLGWNMAYNISVTCNDFEDRWRWVQRGIELVRDDGVTLNPKDPELYKELSWLYLHKVGQDMDDANRYYKLQLARQMQAVCGPVPVDWAALAQAPRTEAALREQLGADSALWGWLDQNKLSFAELESRFRNEKGILPENLVATLPTAQQEILVRFLRANWLRKVYKMEPARILELNQKFGELDWRLPQAHGIYWAQAGIDCAPGGKDLGCERMVFQGMNQAFKYGRLVMPDPNSDQFDTTPNLALLPAVDQAYRDTMAKHEKNNSVRGGYENFLIDATVTLYTFGREREAQEYLKRLRSEFDNPKHRQPLEEFVLSQLAEDVANGNRSQAQGTVQGYLLQSCYWAAMGDDEHAVALEKIAGQIWKRYMRQIGKGTEERRGLAPLPEMKKYVVGMALRQFPPALSARLRALTGDVPYPEETVPAPPRGTVE